MAWLARRGMRTVPIVGSAAHVVDVPAPLDGHLEPRLRDSGSPTVVLVIGADAKADETRPSDWAADDVLAHNDASLREWVEALLLKTHPTARDHIRVGPLDIDAARRSARIGDSDIRLTPTEFRLLNYLAEHAGRVVGHTELLSTVWGPGYADDIHLLQETIRALRGRISLVINEQLIESVYGSGYRMAAWATENAALDAAQDLTERLARSGPRVARSQLNSSRRISRPRDRPKFPAQTSPQPRTSPEGPADHRS